MTAHERQAREIEALRAENAALRAERDNLKSMLIHTTTRHFAQLWKDSADDKKLDECLSEGIAMLEAERDQARAEVEALRAENGRLRDSTGRIDAYWQSELRDCRNERDQLRTELEAARGLLQTMRRHTDEPNGYKYPVSMWFPQIDTFLTGTPAPEVQAEQGERQEAKQKPVGHVFTMQPCFPGEPMRAHAQLHVALPAGTKLYAEPQPSQDVRALAAFALELIDGALEGGSFDGGDIQEAGVRHGLLVVEQREESCGEHCACVEYGFPAECYRLTPAIAAHRQTQSKGGSHG
jgi:cell division protein FtsB